MATQTAPRIDPLRPRTPVAETELGAPPPAVKIWAWVGGIALASILFIWGRWVTGPYFKSVPSGPSQPPGWMKVALDVFTPISAGLVVFLWYWFAWRSWRRDRRVSSDGLLVLALPFVWFQDPLTNWFTPWYTINSYMPNMGSWTNDMPGWMWPGSPGHVTAEAPLFSGALYVYMLFSFGVAGTWVMRRLKARRPRWNLFYLLAGSYVMTFVLDVILEGFIWMPLGFYSYPGAPGPNLFPSTYHRFPLMEPAVVGLLMTGVAALRYFKNDQGQTLVERGCEKIAGGGRQFMARFLATVAATQLIMLLGFTVPTLIFTSHASTWPRDIQKRSYLTDYLCGAGTTVACPADGIPIPRGSNSARLSPTGRLIPARGYPGPRLVPFDRGAPGGSR